MKYLFTIILFSFFSFKRAGAQTNDSLLITELVRNIAGLQSRENGKYIKGCFPSFRECAGAPHNYRPDNNILFTPNLVSYRRSKATCRKLVFRDHLTCFSFDYHHPAIFSSFGRILSNKIEGKVKLKLTKFHAQL